MSKVKNPILFSAHYGIDPERLSEAGLIDPFLNVDTQLFIDPVLLQKSANPIIRTEALQAFRGHFDNFVRLLVISQREGNAAWRSSRSRCAISGRHRMSEGTMAWRVCLLAGLSFVLLGGCASVGNESIADATSESVSAQLVKGRTTQENVRGLYGDPAKTTFTDTGNEIWEYDFSRMHSKPTNFIPYVNLIHSGAEGDKKSLVIFFDKSKVVRQYTISSSKVDVSQGLITR
jgi:hypothetical protein